MNNEIVKPTRIEWIDIAKGLGIILVIMGHAVSNDRFILRFTYNFIYSFHMPLFFIISGILTKDRRVFSKKFLKKTAHSYLTPYVFYSFVYMGLFYAIAFFENKNIPWGNYRLVHVTTLCGLAPLWFLISLFFASVFFNWILEKLNFSKLGIIILLTVCLILSVILSTIFNSLENTWIENNLMGIFRLFPILVFFSFEYLFKNRLTCTKKCAILIVVFSFALQVFLCYFFKNNIDLQLFRLGNPILYFIKSINGSIMIIYLSQLLSHCKIISYICKNIGKKSKEIMILHYNPIIFINIATLMASYIFSDSILILFATSAFNLILCLLFNKLASYFKIYRLSMGYL